MALRQLLICVVLALQPLATSSRHQGCWPGPGSPPCKRTYHGSGHALATPRPGPHAMPTPNPGGSLVPACMCPNLFPRAAPAPAPAPAADNQTRDAIPDLSGLRRGELEVLTVDVRVANKVRCNNASLAEEVAKLLHIPVQRVEVTPWSWTLDTPQERFLALLQQDHERCDCKTESGTMMRGQGFRKVLGESHGAALGSDGTEVMTVAEYDAMMAGARKAMTTTPPPGPPPARVQMLTRDPCLVKMLRQHTSHFRERLAFMLGLPQKRVIVDPPSVRGTVGLLQLSTRVGSESEMRRQPFLGVHHCSAAEAVEAEKRLHTSSFLSERQPWTKSPGNSSKMTYVVAAPDIVNMTNTSAQRVSLVMKLSNINYDLLTSSVTLVSLLTAMTKGAISAEAHLSESNVKMSLYPGPVVVDATITPPADTAPEAVLAFLNGTACSQTALRLNALGALKPVQTGLIECTILSLSLDDTPPPAEESNRAWIAPWSVVLLPPFAEDAAFHLLELVNTPTSAISKLLPFTLARVPGLKYRSLQEPNAANETRLPPPEDRAIGLALPEPYDKGAALKAEMERMKEEEAVHQRAIQEKFDKELMNAQSTLHMAEHLAGMIKQANMTFVKAANAHLRSIRGFAATEVPEVVPYDLLDDRYSEGESPYMSYGLLQSAHGQQPLLHPPARLQVPKHQGFLSQRLHESIPN